MKRRERGERDYLGTNILVVMMYVNSPNVLNRGSSLPLQEPDWLAVCLLPRGLTGEQRHLVPGVDQAAVVLHWAVALGDHQL